MPAATATWPGSRRPPSAGAIPRALWPEARSVVMLAMSYAPGADPLRALDEPSRGVISVYAQGKDYHDILKAKLKTLAASLSAKSGAEVKVFVDTAPVMEKPLAAAAGIGWQGKHTNLVSREHGSWLFLGAILTDRRARPPTRPRPTIAAAAAAASTSARRTPFPRPTCSMRAAASPT